MLQNIVHVHVRIKLTALRFYITIVKFNTWGSNMTILTRMCCICCRRCTNRDYVFRVWGFGSKRAWFVSILSSTHASQIYQYRRHGQYVLYLYCNTHTHTHISKCMVYADIELHESWVQDVCLISDLIKMLVLRITGGIPSCLIPTLMSNLKIALSRREKIMGTDGTH